MQTRSKANGLKLSFLKKGGKRSLHLQNAQLYLMQVLMKELLPAPCLLPQMESMARFLFPHIAYPCTLSLVGTHPPREAQR